MTNHVPPRDWPERYGRGEPMEKPLDYADLMARVDVVSTGCAERGDDPKRAARKILSILKDVPPEQYRRNRNPGT